MLPNTYYLEQYTQMRHQEMVKEARLVQLIQKIKGEKPKLWQKLTWRVGDWMIDTGYRLKRKQHGGRRSAVGGLFS
jgi:hypothetical protein